MPQPPPWLDRRWLIQAIADNTNLRFSILDWTIPGLHRFQCSHRYPYLEESEYPHEREALYHL
jgi:hypothetical protein